MYRKSGGTKTNQVVGPGRHAKLSKKLSKLKLVEHAGNAQVTHR